MPVFFRFRFFCFVILFPSILSASHVVETEGAPTGKQPKSSEIYTLSYETQLPEDPGGFDAPSSSSCLSSVTPLEVMWVEPDDGVDENTGILLRLYGIYSGNDCNRQFVLPDPDWPEEKNVIIAVPFYRNISFASPYDYGKYQVVDVLRALGTLLEQYPQINRKRLYLMGGSGGGHVTLQTLQFTPGLWAEVHVHRAITKISTREDVENNLYEEDPYWGWNVNLGYPIEQGVLSDEEWGRFQAERALRSPQSHVSQAPVFSAVDSQLVPPVWMMHGTADTTVDIQHFHDYRLKIESATGITSTVLDENNWQLGNWRFTQVVGGTHSFPSNTYINQVHPDAFLREKNENPDLTLDSSLPMQGGYTYWLHGDSLSDAIIEVQYYNAASNWELYR